MISKSAADTKTGRVEDAGKFARMAKFFLAIISSSVMHPLENSIIVQVRVPVPRTIYNLNNSRRKCSHRPSYHTARNTCRGGLY